MGLTWKILLFTSLLVVGLMLAILGLTSTQAEDMARASALGHLAGSRQTWEAFRAEQSEKLQLGVRVLANDPAFKAAVQTGDAETVRDLLHERGSDLAADYFVATDPTGVVVARSDDERAGGTDLSPDPLVRAALAGSRQGAAVGRSGAHLFHAVAVPMRFGDHLVGVLLAGYRIDARLAATVGRLTHGEILFVAHDVGAGRPVLAAASHDHAGDIRPDVLGAEGEPYEVGVRGESHLALRLPLVSAAGETVGSVVILRSVQHELAPLQRFRRTVTFVSLGVLVLALGLAGAASSRITGPLRLLVAAVDQARDGAWPGPLPIRSSDEIGSLAQAFDRMQAAIATREEEIRRMALQDPVTRLANRALFNDRLENAFGLSQRGRTPLTVLLLDLERFRDVNDSLGHAGGDEVLREVGARLRSVLRTSDTVARLASDEFAVLLPVAPNDEARRVARKILARLEPEIRVGARALHVRASIGIATSPQHGDDPAALLRHADLARQVARRNGSSFAVYDANYGEGGQERLLLAEELHRAIDAGELVVHYQPKVDLRTGAVVAVEALVRWQHPVHGLLGPARFVPLAEQTGLIRRVTRCVLEQVVAQSSAWRRRGLEVEVAVNVSARDLLGRELPDLLRALLRTHDVDPGSIWLELTESSVMEDPAHALELLRRLRAMGLRLSIDDFGTGYSSLAYLKRLPVNELKIDKSFVSGLTSDADDATIVRTTVELGHTMGLRVVAEGVETADAWNALAALGCDLAQGYHVSAALPAADLEGFALGRLAPEPARAM